MGHHPVSSHCLGDICASQTWSSFSHTHVPMCVRAHKEGILYIKILEMALKPQRNGLAVEGVCNPSAPAVSGGGSSPALPKEAEKHISTWCNSPAHKVRNDQGKWWRPGEMPLTSKRMFWAGCFQEAEVSFQCTFIASYFQKKLSAGQRT